MGKICVEVCLISARGLRRSISLWKLQWFVVGWIDPNSKYCSKVDSSGNANPVWKTKFATLVDESNLQDTALHIEVYSRDPIFLREKLRGTATVVLKEFLDKHTNSSETSRPRAEEVGSFQLRKGNSGKPQGFIDVSIRISEEREEPSPYLGNEGGIVLMGRSNNLAVSAQGKSEHPYPTELPLPQFPRPEDRPSSYPYSHPMPYPTNYPNPSISGPSYQPAIGPSYQPPPPPPSNIGYIPNFAPNSDYINMPSSVTGGPGRGTRAGLAMGVGGGALAAGAVIFGDDLLSGFNVPAGLQHPSLTINTDPPF